MSTLAGITGRVLPVLAAYGAAAMTPGASVVVVAQTSLASGRFKGVLTAFGVALGTAIYAAASLFGLSALVFRVPFALRLVQIGGGIYLTWLGIRLLIGRSAPALGDEPGGTGGDGAGGAFGRGLLTNLSNPHTVIFFVGIFSTMLSPSVPTSARAVVLFAVVAMSVTWYTTVAVALSSPRAQGLYQRTGRVIDVVAGTVMVWFAARFVLSAIQ